MAAGSLMPQYTGTLRKGDAPDTVQGEIRDAWGWTIRIEGRRVPGGGYELTGTLGDVPEALRVPAVDGDIA